MQISVLYFASARERAGTSRELYEWPEKTNVGTALQLIVARHPSLAPLVPHLRVSGRSWRSFLPSRAAVGFSP